MRFIKCRMWKWNGITTKGENQKSSSGIFRVLCVNPILNLISPNLLLFQGQERRNVKRYLPCITNHWFQTKKFVDCNYFHGSLEFVLISELQILFFKMRKKPRKKRFLPDHPVSDCFINSQFRNQHGFVFSTTNKINVKKYCIYPVLFLLNEKGNVNITNYLQTFDMPST